MTFSTLAYAKLNLEFDRDLFINEYDEKIFPAGRPASNSDFSLFNTVGVNKLWGMIPEEEYLTTDYFIQSGNINTISHRKNNRPVWRMFQLMNLDTTNVDNPLLKEWAEYGTSGLRNETLDERYNFYLKPGFEKLKIIQWIYDKLPFKKINFLHCVSVEPNCFASIHRDGKAFLDNGTSAGQNRLYNAGFIIVNINISDGGVPLYWSLDGDAVTTPSKVNDHVYITNDYFLHGVPICSSRRRQIRITGIPKPEFWNLIDKDTVIDLGTNYRFDDIKNRYPG